MTQASTASLGTAAITGASSGIGRIYADRLARKGYNLLLIARRGELLEKAAAELRQAHGVAVETLVADLGSPPDLASTAKRLAEDSAITLLVNNAGVSTLAPVADTTQGQIDAMLSVNIAALVTLSRAVVERFRKEDSGTLVNIGSVLGFATLPISSVYSATKAFVHLFTRGLQDELQDSKVRVHLVLPAATATDIWELSGVPLEHLDASIVMKAEHCVDAALAGLDAGERVTMPSVEDVDTLTSLDKARLTLLTSSQTGRPATRYNVA
ncbi:SDR family NAD(P)-dependent oxidoreductase [Roseateles noduli]|uniref:SDR family NAD(P)-dependent oxidoreductase n=1 Tax=Roseateles noduli TaxID=2052484 RepID=UPI003D654042